MPNTVTIWTTGELVDRTGVSRQQISNIASQRGWQRVTGYTGDIEQYLKEREMNNEQVLVQYEIGQTIKWEHPGSLKEEEATITAFVADDRGKRDGVMIQFSDGVYFAIEAARLA